LLVACDPAGVDEVLSVFRDEGFAAARVIGEVTEGAPVVDVA
jgi:selenide,water dikinase